MNKEKEGKRFEQLDRLVINKIYRLIKDNLNDSELALIVSLQLQRTEELNRLKKEKLNNSFLTLSDKLREIADTLENN